MAVRSGVRQGGEPSRLAALSTRPQSRWFSVSRLAIVVFLSLLAAGTFVFVKRRQAADPEDVWKAAQLALKVQRLDDADAAVRRLGTLRAPTSLDWMLRGQVAIARGRIEEALDCLSRVPDDHGMGAQARLMAGQVELRRDRARIAESYFLKALAIDPRLAQAHRELIYIYGMQLRRSDLNDHFRELSEITDLAFENVFHWVLVKSCSWEPGEAAETLAKFVEADPEDRASRIALVENYERLGMLDEAESLLTALGEDDRQARAFRVLLALDRRDQDRAETLLAGGPPDDPELARLRGRLALAQRNGPEAVRQFRIAYSSAPENRDAIFGLINAMTLIGEDDKTAPYRAQARNLEWLGTLVQRAATPSVPRTNAFIRELGDACHALGQEPEARAWYRIAIARDPLDREAQQALFRLDPRRNSKAARDSRANPG